MRTDRVEFLDLSFDRLTFSQVKDRLRAVTPATTIWSGSGANPAFGRYTRRRGFACATAGS